MGDLRIVITKEMEDEIRQLNVTYIRTQDRLFRSISVKSCQSAVYEYVIGDGWEERKAAGCLFMYRRYVYPRMGFIIMNRLGRHNWIYTFRPKRMRFREVDNFLLFKYGREIKCIWFYVKTELETMTRALRRMGALQVNGDDEPEHKPPHDSEARGGPGASSGIRGGKLDGTFYSSTYGAGSGSQGGTGDSSGARRTWDTTRNRSKL